MVFNGKKLKLLIESKSMKLKLKPSEVRALIRKEIGITKQTLSSWEKENNSPKIEHLFQLRDFFEVPSVDLFFKGEKKQ